MRDWKDQLSEMGISKQVIQFAKLDGSKDNKLVSYVCQYPPRIAGDTVTYDQIYRSRVLPDERVANPTRQRFYNPTKENLPDGVMPPFYTPNYKALKQAVQKNNGVLYLLEGDRDPWSLMSAGVYNVAGMIGAGSTVDFQLAVTFLELGAKHIVYIPDVDNAGWGLAQKLNNVFAKVNISFAFLGLPTYFNKQRIKDLSDLWIALDFDPAGLLNKIDDLRPLNFKSKDIEQQEQSQDLFDSQFWTDIEQSLGLTDFNSDGWSKKQIKCVMHEHEHDDTSPAFSWNHKYKIGRCFKCGENFLSKDVGLALGINMADYYKNDLARATDIQAQRQESVQQEKERGAGGELQLARGIMSGLSELPEHYSSLPDEAFMVWSDDAADRYIARLNGGLSSQYPPILNPVKALHDLGGLGHILTPPIMVGILGSSGGFKTSLMVSMVNELRRQGHHGIIYSPEWDADKHTDRTIQQLGGLKMAQISNYERWHYEQAMMDTGELDLTSQFGHKPKDYQIDKSRKLAQKLKGLSGKLVYLNQFGANILEVLAMIRVAYQRMTAAGFRPSYLVFDYAQLALAPPNWVGNWTINDTVTYTKVITLQLGLITFMSTQARKDDATKMREDGKVMGSNAAQFLRDDQFNLFMTLNPSDEIIDYHGAGRFMPIKIAVTKNSLGATRRTKDDAIEVFADVDRMIVVRTPNTDEEPLYHLLDSDDDTEHLDAVIESSGDEFDISTNVGYDKDDMDYYEYDPDDIYTDEVDEYFNDNE